MNAIKKEIKQALLGDMISVDGRLVTSGKWTTKYRFGFRDGFDRVLFLGVMSRKRWYRSKKSEKQLKAVAIKAMQDMGRMMYLQSDLSLEAVYCTYLMNQPSILTFSQGTNGIEVTAFSGRGISGWIAILRTLNRFQKGMSQNMERLSEEDEMRRKNAVKQKDTEEKKREKQDKLDQKQEKKKQKKDKKQAKKKERWKKTTGNLPKNPLTFMSGKEKKQPVSDSSVAVPSEGTPEQMTKEVATGTSTEKARILSESPSLESMRQEQERLEVEAEQARLAAEVAKAKLEVARAQKEAEEAEAELARLKKNRKKKK